MGKHPGDYRDPKAARAGAVKAARRRRMAMDLRAAGLTYEDIAQQMTASGEKISKARVQAIVTTSLKAHAAADAADIEQVRHLDLHRIDLAMQVLMPKVRAGDLKAMREWRAFIDQRARLLGTYAPQQMELRGQIDHVLNVHDREEVARLEEAFVASTAIEIPPGELPEFTGDAA